MKLIFLDIDGVLNHELFYKSGSREERFKLANEEKDLPYGCSNIDPEKVSLLNTLIKETGAKVVVSSSWRTGRSVEDLQAVLDWNGFQGEVIGKTIRLGFKTPKDVDYNYSVPRGCEIKAWLEMNKSILNAKISKVRYVILDDDTDFLWWQRNNFIHVDSYCGITYNTIHKAKHILNLSDGESF